MNVLFSKKISIKSFSFRSLDFFCVTSFSLVFWFELRIPFFFLLSRVHTFFVA